MAKRGETRPYRMTYTWPGGVKGTTSHQTLDRATFAAEQQAKVIGPTGDRCAVTVTHRARPSVALLTLAPERQDD